MHLNALGHGSENNVGYYWLNMISFLIVEEVEVTGVTAVTHESSFSTYDVLALSRKI